jgi:hypothetical protein
VKVSLRKGRFRGIFTPAQQDFDESLPEHQVVAQLEFMPSRHIKRFLALLGMTTTERFVIPNDRLCENMPYVLRLSSGRAVKC